jgi:lysyl-tRNA synthetase class 2
MRYTLNRCKALNPAPPFELAGEYLHLEGRHFLRILDSARELKMTIDLLSTFENGDLLCVLVVAVEGKKGSEVFKIGRAHALQIREREPKTLLAPHAALFPRFVQTIRTLLLKRGLEEIFTPSLVKCPGLEPSLIPFALEVRKGSHVTTAYLPTSPEIHLKKAMSLGFTDIFEIKNCFRKNELSPNHENEFTMLEWYRGFADLQLIEEDLRFLIKNLEASGWIKPSTKGEVSTAPLEIRTITCRELFKQDFGFELTPKTSKDELEKLCTRYEIEHLPKESFNDLYHRLWITAIEPALGKEGPLLVKDYPPSQAALAKLTEAGWADRMEFYWQGLEIANAFNEVTDAKEQKRRWEIELAERKHLGTGELPMDEDLFHAFQSGFPPTGGIALGMERLYMACQGVEAIQDLRVFPLKDLFAE